MQLPRCEITAASIAGLGGLSSQQTQHPSHCHHGFQRQDDGEGMALSVAFARLQRLPLASQLQQPSGCAAECVDGEPAQRPRHHRGRHFAAWRDGAAGAHREAHHRCDDQLGCGSSGELHELRNQVQREDETLQKLRHRGHQLPRLHRAAMCGGIARRCAANEFGGAAGGERG